jgi:hypothetical protein
MGPVEGLVVPEGYVYGLSRRWYCRPACREGARRKRDRERKAGINRARKRVWVEDKSRERQPDVGVCMQCRQRRALRFDSYGPALDDHLTVTPSLCSADCVVAWWSSQPGVPDVSPDIAALMTV